MPDTVVRDLTEKLENGVKELFESDKYAEYLKTMSRFYSYSSRNVLLIHLQDPNARRVASYTSWKNNFNRQVKKGEHGIKIFAPVANRDKDIEVEKLDPVTKLPILDENGQPIMERLSPTSNLQIRFKLVTVFSEEQTEGDPLPELAETLTGNVERYELFMDALRAVSPLPIVFANLPDADGECRFGEEIVINNGMSEIQTVSVVLHEIVHAKLHDINIVTANGEQPQDRRTQEIEAESCAFVVLAHYEIDTGANSFGYLASWAKDREMKELTASLDVIRKTAASLIGAIDEKYSALAKERGIDLTAKTEKSADEVEAQKTITPPRKETRVEMEYSELQKKGIEIAKTCSSLSLQDRLDIIAQTFNCKTGRVETHPCTGKWRGTSDIAVVFDNGASLFIGNHRTPDAKKPSVISECVNNTLSTYNPEIVAEAKKRAEFALLKREAEDNAVAAEHGLKQYKVLNVEFNDGSDNKTGGHIGWYYVTIAVEGKIFGHLTSNLNSDITRGVVGEKSGRPNYFVAGGLRDGDADYVFDNVGHSTTSDSYKMELTAAVLQRAQETLDRRERFNGALEGMKTVKSHNKTLENRLYDKLAELFPDFLSGKYSYLKLESPGMEPLSLEWVGKETISIMHTYTMNGDLMYDPMMTFWVDMAEGDETLRPESFEQSMPTLYQSRGNGGEWYSVDGDGNTKFLYLDKNVGKFVEQWFANIAEQGYMPVIGTLVRGENDEVRVAFDKDGNMIEPEFETGNVQYDEAVRHDSTVKQATIDTSLPDPTISSINRNDYGYTYDEMLPLTESRALELYDSNNTVYLLYPDNTEAMALEREDIERHDGIFGIERADWERSPLYTAKMATTANDESKRESELLHNCESMFGIYQIRNDIDEARNFRFAPMRELDALGLTVDRANYELVYSSPFTQRFFHGMLNDTAKTLDIVFEQLNTSPPPDYATRAVSVSDVIVLQQGGEVTAHFVDSMGFKELPTFTGNEREQAPLSQIGTKQAEKQAVPQKPASKSAPTLMDEINEAKRLVARGAQPAAKQNELEV